MPAPACPNCGQLNTDGDFCPVPLDPNEMSCAEQFGRKHALMAIKHVAPTDDRYVSSTARRSHECPRCNTRDTVRESQEGGDNTRYWCRTCAQPFRVFMGTQPVAANRAREGQQMGLFAV